MSPYTEEQRTRYLLAKLKPKLRTTIVTYYEIPSKRDNLVVLVTRLEAANKRSGLIVRYLRGTRAARSRTVVRARSAIGLSY